MAKQGAQLVYRMAAVLNGLAAKNHEGVGMTALAQATGLTGATTHRLLQALVDVRLVCQRPGDRRYILGPLTFELGKIAATRFDLQASYDTEIAALADAIGDTAFFLMRSNLDMLCLSRASGAFPVKTLITEIGMRRPMGVGAGGLAVLAALPREEAQLLMLANAQGYQDAGRTSASVADEVQCARATGYVCRVMPDLGATTVAIALRNSAGHAFACISASAISQRMQGQHLERVLHAMRQTAKRLEAKFDFDSHLITG